MYNVRQGFTGPIYPVNPRYDHIEGLACFPSVMDVPDPVDVAILFVPAPAVPDMVSQCARRGLRGVIVESGGFSEAQTADPCRPGYKISPRRPGFGYGVPTVWD